MKSNQISTVLRASEFFLLFFGVPTSMLFIDKLVHPSIFVLPILILMFVYLKKHPEFRFKELIFWGISINELLKHAYIVVAFFGVMIGFVILLFPEKLFNLPSKNLKIWLLLSTFYPIFSAYGQEIIYRTFLFKRYAKLFPNNILLITASALSFGYVHIFYYHPISLIVTTLGGFYFAKTYSKTKSVIFVAVLHGVLGNLVFASGLGEFFWLDIHKFL